MAANEKDIEEFNLMFNLSSGERDDDEQAEEYGHSTESFESFKDLAKEVSEEIGASNNKGGVISDDILDVPKEDPHEVIKSICSGEVCFTTSLEIKEEKKPTLDDIFDELDSTSVTIEEVIPEDIDDTNVLEGIDVDDVSEDVPEDTLPQECYPKTILSHSINYGEIGSGDDKIEWMLESPSAMYNSFYAKKRDLLFRYMVGGQVEYKRWTQELEEAKVTIQGEVFDHQLIIDQMEAVQQHRERVKAIHVRVNNQYFTFKRFIELMRGFLARIEYLKPVLKQDGLIMEHMRDIELYYARLEALHDSATKTEKTLAAAFDTLSRKCTICMELRPAERIELKELKESENYLYPVPDPIAPVSIARKLSTEFDEFDDLPTNAHVAPVEHKIGAISWGDI